MVLNSAAQSTIENQPFLPPDPTPRPSMLITVLFHQRAVRRGDGTGANGAHDILAVGVQPFRRPCRAAHLRRYVPVRGPCAAAAPAVSKHQGWVKEKRALCACGHRNARIYIRLIRIGNLNLFLGLLFLQSPSKTTAFSCSCISKVKRMGWRGLWMTKNIEGTVDDDIAAKLAIGEGRQVRPYFERMFHYQESTVLNCHGILPNTTYRPTNFNHSFKVCDGQHVLFFYFRTSRTLSLRSCVSHLV